MSRVAETLDAIIASELATWPGRAAAGVVVGLSSTSNAEPAAASGPIDEAFGWASVTKLLVSIASLVALEEGTVNLQDPVGPAGSTLAHVLSHASGLPFEGDTPIAPPATRRIYSNTGIELAAAHLERAAGMPFGEYLRAGVLEPLGMGQTVLNGSPAHGAKGPVTDLLALAGELSAPSLVSAETLRCCHFGGVAGTGRRPAGFRASAPVRLGPRPGNSEPEKPSLDRQGQLSADFRPFWPVRLLPVGRPGGARRRGRFEQYPVRAVGQRGVAYVLRCRAGRVRTGTGGTRRSGREVGPNGKAASSGELRQLLLEAQYVGHQVAVTLDPLEHGVPLKPEAAGVGRRHGVVELVPGNRG